MRQEQNSDNKRSYGQPIASVSPPASVLLLVLLGAFSIGGCPNTGIPSGTSMTQEEQQFAADVLTAINAHRATQGLAPLSWYETGAQVAYDHSLAMEAGGFFAHVDPNTDTDPATRAKNAGITHDPEGSIDPHSGNPFVGENLYMAVNANPTAQDAVDAWIASPGHYTQIVAPSPVAGAQTMPAWTHCSVGVRKTGNESWWTANFFRDPN